MNTSFKIKGEITVRMVDYGGNEISRFTQDNLVVNTGKQVILHRLGGHTNDTEIPSKMYFGNESRNIPALTDTITAPSSADHLINISATTYPAFNQIQFTAELPIEAGNGQAFRYVELRTLEYLISRVQFNAPISKDANFSIFIDWLISIQ